MGAAATLAEYDTVRRLRRTDAALATWREAKAVELALAGSSYDEIAHEIGLANRGNAWRTVQRALNDRVVAGVDELREVECARLDALQAAAWPRAQAGDLKAINAVLRIVDRRARLLGLYGVTGATTAPMRTIVQVSNPATRRATEPVHPA